MIIEVGKHYKTRNGDRVRIYALDAGGDFPIHGAILGKVTSAWQPCSWAAGGTHLPHGEIADNDLLEEWPNFHDFPSKSIHLAPGEATTWEGLFTQNRRIKGRVRVDLFVEIGS